MKDLQIDFMGKRKYALVLSAALLVTALLSFGSKGSLMGLDFTGGSLLEVGFTEEAPKKYAIFCKGRDSIMVLCSILAPTVIC